MAVELFNSTQILAVGAASKNVIEDYAKLRMSFFDVVPTVTGDANSTADLIVLPPGRVRVLPHLSKLWNGIFGASRLIDVGYRAFEKELGAIEAEDLNDLAVGIDVSAAANNVAFGTARKYDFFSRRGVTISAQCRGGTWPSGISLNGYVAYLVE